ncbi:MAG: iron ABC transporter permease [Clostridia bacterium]|nr:iron ABC transporter permease [Clostridia bacterium]MBN2882281.1 iron ABC transporter permease [Clostridia bacterium]
MRKRADVWIYIALVASLLAAIIFSAGRGSADIGFIDSMKIILSRIPLIGKYVDIRNLPETYSTIIFSIRLPRILTSILCGTGLSICGVLFQGMFRNPMADPYILGISSGAVLGAAIAFVTGTQAALFNFSLVPIFAFIGAIIATAVVYMIAQKKGNLSTNILILSGIAIGFLCSSLLSLIIIASREQAQRIIFWTMGSMTGSSWNTVLVMLPFILIGSLVLLFNAGNLNILSTGDETAVSLGINASALKKLLLLVASLVTAISVCFCGTIGFVGLIIPHAVRFITGPDHKRLMPISALTGAIFLLLCDTAARTLFAPQEIPIGVITSLLGVPFFISLLIRTKRRSII